MKKGERFPLPMKHPNFRPARLGTSDEIDHQTGKIKKRGKVGRPSLFPPRVANNPGEEEYLTSRGYVPSKGGLPKMVEEVYDEAAPETVGALYPRYVGTTRCNNEAEYEAAMAAPANPPPANPEPAPVDVDSRVAVLEDGMAKLTRMMEQLLAASTKPTPDDADRAALEAEAERVGVKVNRRWRTARLREEVEAARQPIAAE
jgi:hypothetical protein